MFHPPCSCLFISSNVTICRLFTHTTHADGMANLRAKSIEWRWRSLKAQSVFVFRIISLFRALIINLNWLNHYLYCCERSKIFRGNIILLILKWIFLDSLYISLGKSRWVVPFPKSIRADLGCVTVIKYNLCKYIGLKLKEKCIQIYARLHSRIIERTNSMQNCFPFISRKCHCSI